MATRNLTEAFTIMRNNALQTKNIYAEQVQYTNSDLVNKVLSQEIIQFLKLSLSAILQSIL